jgi:glycosyltransferase involved in cell wall biosynthesis
MGGSGRYLREICRGLVSLGHQVHVMTRQWNPGQPKEEQWGGIEVYRYPVDDRNTISTIASTARNTRTLYRHLIRKNAYDIINFHNPLAALGIVRTKGHDRAISVYTFHSPWHKEYEIKMGSSPSLLRGVEIGLRKTIERAVLKRCSLAVVLSRYMENQLKVTHPGLPVNVVQCPGGADIHAFRPAEDRTAVRSRLKWPQDRTVLLTVRGLTPRTGVENLIKAMAEVVKRDQNIHLVIGGGGPLKESLQRLVGQLGLSGHISFAGVIPDNELTLYYQAADYFILPTRYLEGFGLVTAEALSCGLPVLGTPVGGTKEILNALDKDLLFDGIGPEAMVALILKYARVKGELWETLSCRCRVFIEDHYTWEASAKKTERAFLSLIKK